ncbi:hypothetical protein GCM10028783_36990 [Modestobacter muralis]|uniref:hypothetical protein n=1 Tax=Modestobacter muralis TaxID=1608614 RepID=UPI001B8C156A|nr:hypothetical protein [Modestobacter muralis]
MPRNGLTRLARAGRLPLLLFGLVLWVAVPAVAVWLLQHRADSVTLADPQTVYVEVQANTAAVVQEVNISLRLEGGATVLAPALTGIVEQLLVQPGQTLTSGQPLAVIGGMTRLAVNSERPFARPLAVGDKGPDVAMLHATLTSLGYSSGAGSTYSQATARGVAQLQKAVSQVPGGDTSGASFDPNWFFYLPAGEVVVATNELVLGAPAPAAGEPVLTARRSVTEATLTLEQDAGDQAPAGVEQPTGPDTSAPSPAEVTPPEADAQPVQSFTAPADAQLAVNGTPLELVEDRAHVAPASFPALLELLEPGSRTVGAQLTTAPGPGEFSVPAAAIFTSQTGNSCVLARRGTATAAERVVVVGNTFDRAVVTGDLTDDVTVAVSPPARDRTCA